jgi:signal transduction histidine kinase
MKKDMNQDLINEIVALSSEQDEKLNWKILEFIEIYEEQKREIQQVQKQNDFFVKQWDKRNILTQEKDLKKDKMLEQQSRLASMGEIIDAIAHQWKQPLNSLSMMSDMLREDFKLGIVDQQYIDELDDTFHLQIDFMVNTLSEFRTFFRPSTQDELCYMQDVLSSVQILMKDELLSQNIYLDLDIDKTIKINANKNEFKHLFINLINNSIDAFNEKKITERKIFIRCYRENSNIYIEVEDNAQGISLDVLHEIFKPNVTTKPEGKGTGIGLYMCSQIVKKNNGTINVHNTETGAFFTITLRQTTKL